MTCTRCGDPNGRAKYCKPCAKEVKDERTRRQNNKSRNVPFYLYRDPERFRPIYDPPLLIAHRSRRWA